MKIKFLAFAALAISSVGFLHAQNVEQINCNEYTLEGGHKINEDAIKAAAYDFGKLIIALSPFQ